MSIYFDFKRQINRQLFFSVFAIGFIAFSLTTTKQLPYYYEYDDRDFSAQLLTVQNNHHGEIVRETAVHYSQNDSNANEGLSMNMTKYITYEVVKGLQYRAKYDPAYMGKCFAKDRVFHNSFQKKGVLDFHTLIETNLNILFVGDSVGLQFAHAFQEAAQPSEFEVIRYQKGKRANSDVALVKGGGTISDLRISGMMSHKNEGKIEYMAPGKGGGWFEHDVIELKRISHTWRQVKSLKKEQVEISPCKISLPKHISADATAKSSNQCKQKDFDVVVHQLPVRRICCNLFCL
mmetsp:Transcript_25523/g.58883  ORF Transcript_25523/g.58883 Transcript_25523/m.58883 type:complete len:291 (+) Transcript_25523:119-991(+)